MTQTSRFKTHYKDIQEYRRIQRERRDHVANIIAENLRNSARLLCAVRITDNIIEVDYPGEEQGTVITYNATVTQKRVPGDK